MYSQLLPNTRDIHRNTALGDNLKGPTRKEGAQNTSKKRYILKMHHLHFHHHSQPGMQ